jgi:hypothetical protein
MKKGLKSSLEDYIKELGMSKVLIKMNLKDSIKKTKQNIKLIEKKAFWLFIVLAFSCSKEKFNKYHYIHIVKGDTFFLTMKEIVEKKYRIHEFQYNKTEYFENKIDKNGFTLKFQKNINSFYYKNIHFPLLKDSCLDTEINLHEGSNNIDSIPPLLVNYRCCFERIVIDTFFNGIHFKNSYFYKITPTNTVSTNVTEILFNPQKNFIIYEKKGKNKFELIEIL